MDRVQKDFREYFYRDQVGLVRGQRPTDLATSQHMMAFVESGRDEGGCAIEDRANVAGVKVHGG